MRTNYNWHHTENVRANKMFPEMRTNYNWPDSFSFMRPWPEFYSLFVRSKYLYVLRENEVAVVLFWAGN